MPKRLQVQCRSATAQSGILSRLARRNASRPQVGREQRLARRRRRGAGRLSLVEVRARAERRRSAMPDVFGIKPNPCEQREPLRVVEQVNFHRFLDCPSYDRCLLLSGTAGWKGFTCRACDVYKLYANDEHRRLIRRAYLEREAERRQQRQTEPATNPGPTRRLLRRLRLALQAAAASKATSDQKRVQAVEATAVRDHQARGSGGDRSQGRLPVRASSEASAASVEHDDSAAPKGGEASGAGGPSESSR